MPSWPAQYSRCRGMGPQGTLAESACYVIKADRGTEAAAVQLLGQRLCCTWSQ